MTSPWNCPGPTSWRPTQRDCRWSWGMAGHPTPPSPPCRVGKWETPNRRYYVRLLLEKQDHRFIRSDESGGGAVQRAEDPLKRVKKANCSWGPQSQGHKSPIPALGCTETNFANVGQGRARGRSSVGPRVGPCPKLVIQLITSKLGHP